MGFRALVTGLVLAASFAAPARAQTLMEDVGALMALRLYSVGLMTYCFDNVEARPAFHDASTGWTARNLDDMAIVDKVFGTLPVKAEDLAGLLQYVSNTITFEMAGALDGKAHCQEAAEQLNAGVNDVGNKAPEQLARVKAANPAP